MTPLSRGNGTNDNRGIRSLVRSVVEIVVGSDPSIFADADSASIRDQKMILDLLAKIPPYQIIGRYI